MQIPISYALSYPKRLKNNIEKLDLFDIYDLRFEKPDMNKFPCLRLAYRAIEEGHSAQVVLNAANEVMVAAFLEGRVKYTDIPRGIEKMMDFFPAQKLCGVSEILAFDEEVRNKTEEFINNREEIK